MNTAPDIFVTTRWTAVISAAKGDDMQSMRALEELCATYWFPLYAYVRRQGKTREDAEDLVQAFFERLLRGNWLENLSSERGKFRAFLLAAMKNFLANEWDKSRCQKRGGHATHFSLDWQTADSRFQIADGITAGPEEVFDREWAVALLGKVLDSLREEFARSGKLREFEILKGCIAPGHAAMPGVEAAAALGMEPGALRVGVHRLRRRYRRLLREEIARTLADPSQVEEEMSALFKAFAA